MRSDVTRSSCHRSIRNGNTRQRKLRHGSRGLLSTSTGLAYVFELAGSSPRTSALLPLKALIDLFDFVFGRVSGEEDITPLLLVGCQLAMDIGTILALRAFPERVEIARELFPVRWVDNLLWR